MAEELLNVFLHDRLAGALRRKGNGNLQFRYADEYVEAEEQPLSWNLPLRAEAFPHRDCLAFFGNLLPEEDVRAQLSLATGISASNDYRLLKRFGGDVAGAVTLLSPEESPSALGPDRLEALSPRDSTSSWPSCRNDPSPQAREGRCGSRSPGRRASCR